MVRQKSLPLFCSDETGHTGSGVSPCCFWLASQILKEPNQTYFIIMNLCEIMHGCEEEKILYVQVLILHQEQEFTAKSIQFGHISHINNNARYIDSTKSQNDNEREFVRTK